MALREVTFDLCGATYTVRPTFQMVAAIEAATGRGIPELAVEMAQMRIKVSEMAQILFQMTRRQKGPTLNEIGDELVNNGITSLLQPVSEFLGGAFTGNKEMADAAAEDPSAPSGQALN